MAQHGLGRLFDFSIGIAPVDMNTNNGETGKRVSLRNAAAITFVVIKAAGTAAEDPTVTLKQHTASSSGTTANLAVITEYFVKSETTLDGDETWTRVAQSAAATIADPGGAGTSAEEQQIVAFTVLGTQLSDGYDYVSLDYATTASNAQLATVLYVLHDLTVQRAPQNLVAPLS